MSFGDEKIEERRAFSPDQAREAGFNRTSYQFEPVPEGKWTAILDMKIWGESKPRKPPRLVCYFSSQEQGCFKLTAFLARTGEGANKWYSAQDGLLDLSYVRLGSTLELETGVNSKGGPRWISARLVADSDA